MSIEFGKMTMPATDFHHNNGCNTLTEYKSPALYDNYMDYFGIPFIQGHYSIPFGSNNSSFNNTYGNGLLALPTPFITADFFEFESFYEIFADLPGTSLIIYIITTISLDYMCYICI